VGAGFFFGGAFFGAGFLAITLVATGGAFAATFLATAFFATGLAFLATTFLAAGLAFLAAGFFAAGFFLAALAIFTISVIGDSTAQYCVVWKMIVCQLAHCPEKLLKISSLCELIYRRSGAIAALALNMPYEAG
jgi:hypothetical protein